MTEFALSLLIGGLCLVVVLQGYLHAGERREWNNERAALIERLTGATIRAVVETEPRPYGDEGEWAIEQARRGEQVI